MRVDKTQISGLQGMFTLACFLQASTLLASFLSPVTKQESWFVILIAGAICIPGFWIFSGMVRSYPNKNLFQFFEAVYGKVASKILSVLYLFFFIMLTALNLGDLTAFTRLTLMSKTPNVVIIGACVLVAAFGVKKGIKVITRYSLFFLLSSTLVLVATFLFSLGQFDLSNFLPIFNLDFGRYVQSTHILLTIPLGEVIVLGMFVPNIKFKKENMNKYLFFGLATMVFVFLIVKIRDIAVLGNVFHLLEFPPIISLRLINLGEALSRVEILFAVILLMLMFFKITILFYVVVISIAQIFEIEKFWRLTFITGVLITIFTMTFVNTNPIIHSSVARDTTPFLWSIFEFIIPILTFIIGLIKKRTQTGSDLKKGKIKAYKKSLIYGKLDKATKKN